MCVVGCVFAFWIFRSLGFLFENGNKMGVFALGNMGDLNFVVWIFFCNFVDCVWWIVNGG